MDRRTLLIGGGVAAAAILSAGAIWSLVRKGGRGPLDDAQRALVARVSDITIPATETPGALATDTPAFVELAITHGVADLDRSVVGRLEAELAQAGGGAFAGLSAEAQVAALTQLDAQAFAQDAATGEAWRAVKALIATGYYTSEGGASQELQYELVPGRYDPDLPLGENARAWSSDWTAWDFG